MAYFHKYNIQIFEVVKESLLANLLQTEAETCLNLGQLMFSSFLLSFTSGVWQILFATTKGDQNFSDQLCILTLHGLLFLKSKPS